MLLLGHDFEEAEKTAREAGFLVTAGRFPFVAK